MKVLLISSEVAPFAKTGGLADVAGALPIALSKLDVDVRVVMPGYSVNNYNDPGRPRRVIPQMPVTLGYNDFLAEIAEAYLPSSSVPIYFVNNAHFFHRDGLYQNNGTDFLDNPHRFAFFCKAALMMLKELDWIPDVIHCNDWQTGLVPVMLHTDKLFKDDPDYSQVGTLFTIHNMAYQGNFWQEIVAELGLNPSLFSPAGMEFYGAVNLMKGGLVFADKLSTVSPTYAHEIQTPAYGCGLDGVLRMRSDDLIGILNGIDYDAWDPNSDQALTANYNPAQMAGKALCKEALQVKLGLHAEPKTPLLVMISRLDPQKGLDILLPVLPEILKLDVQFAILGTGRADYESNLAEMAKQYPGRMAAVMQFNGDLARQMEAGGDIFMMPSKFEPCGLNQLYSLRYGTLPLVRHTGGLADSVEPIAPDAAWGTGFVFEEYTGAALMGALNQALALYARPEDWANTQRRAMEKDFSWTASAKLYEELYGQCKARPTMQLNGGM